MADETAVQDAPAAEANAEPTGAEPGKQTETAKTFTQAELDTIIKDRLQKAERKATEAAAKAAVDAEAKTLKEQGEYKTLYEKMQAELEQERTARKAAEVAGMRRDVAARLQLPVGLVDRLRGDTAEDIEADARELLAALPKPTAPNINASDASAQGKPLPGGMTEDGIREQAIRLRVPYEHYKAALLGK